MSGAFNGQGRVFDGLCLDFLFFSLFRPSPISNITIISQLIIYIASFTIPDTGIYFIV